MLRRRLGESALQMDGDLAARMARAAIAIESIVSCDVPFVSYLSQHVNEIQWQLGKW